MIFSVRVTARASKSEIAGEMDGALKVRIASPPVDGAANAELIKLYLQMKEYYAHRESLYQAFEKRWAQQARIFRIPDMVRDISDLQALKEMTQLLSQGEKK